MKFGRKLLNLRMTRFDSSSCAIEYLIKVGVMNTLRYLSKADLSADLSSIS